jgi:hypothetical protein
MIKLKEKKISLNELFIKTLKKNLPSFRSVYDKLIISILKRDLIIKI